MFFAFILVMETIDRSHNDDLDTHFACTQLTVVHNLGDCCSCGNPRLCKGFFLFFFFLSLSFLKSYYPCVPRKHTDHNSSIHFHSVARF